MPATLWSKELGDEHVNAIGAVSVEWEALSSILALLAIELARVEKPVGDIWFAHASTLHKLDVIRSVAKHRVTKGEMDQAVCDRIDAALVQINKLREQRNAIVHAKWIPMGTEIPLVQKVTARSGLKIVYERKEASAIRALAVSISESTEEIRQIWIETEDRRRGRPDPKLIPW